MKQDGIHLDGCGCPIQTSALQLWLFKATANNIETGEDECNEHTRLKPATLRIIEAGIQVVSGHTVETLLQDGMDSEMDNEMAEYLVTIPLSTV
jgi:hypothetical protein